MSLSISKQSNRAGLETGRRVRSRSAADFLRRLARRRIAAGGTVVLLVLMVMAVFAPQLAPHDPLRQIPQESLQPPSWAHPFGTDDLGRDILSRILYGSRVSLQVGFVAVAAASVVGAAIGLYSGYNGGGIDNILMRIMDAMLAFPSLVLALAITAVLGPSLTNAMLAIGIVQIPQYARLTRGQALSVREREFVDAARLLGARDTRILLRHVLPNVLTPLIIQASLSVAHAIITESSLSFLGLGAQPPTPTWGSMVQTGYRYLEIAPWFALVPGAAIFLAVMGFNLLGDGIRDALDPRTVLSKEQGSS